ncbi:LysR family transcriptional regulator [Roseovarius sp. C7]|uniref:LysR family transcriptional regulator n=1 Tax=Roseovarius sp. C7 TaxID=3398643 RepID=UPI0039F67142
MLPPTLAKADLHLLHVFSIVAKAGGFSAAQAELNVAASTISRQISDLETRLGMTLCERGRSGFRLTFKGELVLRAAQRLFASIREFSETVDGTRNKLAGHLAIAVIDNWAFNPHSPFLLGLKSFIDRAPDVSIELYSLAPADIEIAVQDGNASLGIGVFHRPKPGLIYEQIARERLGLYCAASHPLFGVDNPDTVEQLLSQANYAKRTYLNKSKVAEVSRNLQSNGSAHQIEGIAHLILTGHYIGYLPEHFAQYWHSQNLIAPVAGGRFDQISEIQLVWKRGSKLNQVSQTFTDLLRCHRS